jgi:carbon storage regulator
MLVLSRKRNESIFIDDNVVVRVLSIHGSRVRLGIEADTGMPVHRHEAHGAKKGRDSGEGIQHGGAPG